MHIAIEELISVSFHCDATYFIILCFILVPYFFICCLFLYKLCWRAALVGYSDVLKCSTYLKYYKSEDGRQ